MTQMMLEVDLFINGTVENIIFHNSDNHFYVIVVEIDETNTELSDKSIITGNFDHINEGESYQYAGEIVEHARYGKQCKTITSKKNNPKTKDGIIKYLSGEKFKGIGQKTAQLIAHTLGDNTLDLIIKSKSNLDKVKGLSEEKKNIVYR